MLNTAAIIPVPRFNSSSHHPLYNQTRYEVFEGLSLAVPVPDIRHQTVALKMASALLRHVEDRKLGRVFQAPCNLVLSERERIIVQPDILFVGWNRRSIIREKNLRGTPDMVIEVLSGPTQDRDLRVKRRLYARYEVPEYWIVDPSGESVEILVHSEMGFVSVGKFRKSDKLSTPLLPNFNLRVSGIFKRQAR